MHYTTNRRYRDIQIILFFSISYLFIYFSCIKKRMEKSIFLVFKLFCNIIIIRGTYVTHLIVKYVGLVAAIKYFTFVRENLLNFNFKISHC